MNRFFEALQKAFNIFQDKEDSRTRIYEVGTFEKYEEGFHAFYRTLTQEKAQKICVLVRDTLNNFPELALNASDEEYQKYFDLCDSIREEFKFNTGIEFQFNRYAGMEYEIVMRSVDIDN
ncbi:hypothetical protein [Acinetobacter guillouiae]|uniref:hypothetical protein n=1 Tax=Acinetobacter guillouiae TaxID=106649 RepID=UPI003C6EF46A